MLLGFFLVLFLGGVVFFLPYFFKFLIAEKRKGGGLEAGFFSLGQAHLRFSLQFIFLILIFIVFDTELLLVFGFILNFPKSFVFRGVILRFLWFTLVFELKWNKLVWVKSLGIEK